MDTKSFNGKIRSFNSRHDLSGTTYSNDWISSCLYGTSSTPVYTTSYASSDIKLMFSVNTESYRYGTVVDNEGDFYISTVDGTYSSSIFKKIDKTGSMVYSTKSEHSDPSLYCDGEYIYSVDKLYSPSSSSASFTKYDKSLAKVWSYKSTIDATTRAITTDSNGNVFVAYYLGVLGSMVTKLSPTGSFIWNATASNSILSLATDRYGSLYISESGSGAKIKKVDSSGATVLYKTLLYGTYSSYLVTNISIIDSTDTIYMSTYDSLGGITSSVPVIAYDLSLTEKSNLGVYAASGLSYESKYVSVSGSGYVYLTKPLGSTASGIEKWSDSTYTKLATSDIIYHSSLNPPSLLVNPIK
jgi:hypothetical protein